MKPVLIENYSNTISMIYSIQCASEMIEKHYGSFGVINIKLQNVRRGMAGSRSYYVVTSTAV